MKEVDATYRSTPHPSLHVYAQTNQKNESMNEPPYSSLLAMMLGYMNLCYSTPIAYIYIYIYFYSYFYFYSLIYRKRWFVTLCKFCVVYFKPLTGLDRIRPDTNKTLTSGLSIVDPLMRRQ